MTLIPPTRKRNRSCEEEDFLPLSKKINNLHINNWGNVDSPQEQIFKWNNTPDQFLPHFSQNMQNGSQDCESRNSSPFKCAQNNSQNSYSETELGEHYKHLTNESYKTSGYSQEKYANSGNGHQEDGTQNGWSTIYSPDLGADENPYYYESNKLLFDLYVERMNRTGY